MQGSQGASGVFRDHAGTAPVPGAAGEALKAQRPAKARAMLEALAMPEALAALAGLSDDIAAGVRNYRAIRHPGRRVGLGAAANVLRCVRSEMRLP